MGNGPGVGNPPRTYTQKMGNAKCFNRKNQRNLRLTSLRCTEKHRRFSIAIDSHDFTHMGKLFVSCTLLRLGKFVDFCCFDLRVLKSSLVKWVGYDRICGSSRLLYPFLLDMSIRKRSVVLGEKINLQNWVLQKEGHHCFEDCPEQSIASEHHHIQGAPRDL